MKQEGDPTLSVCTCDLGEANAFIRRYHRHHKPVVGHKFSLAVFDEAGRVRGVAIVSRPVSRVFDDGWTAEVTRVVTDGCRNAPSALYGASWRCARAMGYRRLVTYTLPEESGASLRGAGWRLTTTKTSVPNWKREGRALKTLDHPSSKHRWEVGQPPPYPQRPDFSQAAEWDGQLVLPLG